MSTSCETTNEFTVGSFRAATHQLGMIALGDGFAPESPADLNQTGVDAEVLANLALKLAYTVPRLTTQWAATKMCLPLQLTAELLERLRTYQLLETLGQAGPFSHHFAITGRGREQATRLLEISGYVGPAPVSLEAYTRNLDWQFRHMPAVTPDAIRAATSAMVLSDTAQQVAGLAMLSRRSLFLYGPAGNGKTQLGTVLHQAVEGDLWIPHAIGLDNNIIRVYDPECHDRSDAEMKQDAAGRVDQRWVHIKRPFVVVGGELTVEALDLSFSRNHGYYEAPLHFKANGGTFLLDDFGCQRVEAQQLLNRWIHPLETGTDYLTLTTGQQVEVPFQQMLIVSTNLDPDRVMSPAFLRRMGYRLHMDSPSAELYAEIFRRYASRHELAVAPQLIRGLIERYETEDRPLRCCEPRDLIERARDICRFQDRDFELNDEVIDLAWRGYFGNGHHAS